MSDTSHAELRTFLIADVRGYTKYTAEHGDQAGAALASRFAELVRDVVPAFDGLLLEIRGDEALVVFVSARRALRAAVELQARFGAPDGLTRGVGIGLDAGEAIPVDGGFRGSALNLAARLCAQAGPGETLASEAVIHLAAKVEGIEYLEPRTLKLKGFDVAVRAVGVVRADTISGRRPLQHRGGRRAARGPMIAGAAGLVSIALVTGLLWSSRLGAPGTGSASESPGATVIVPALAAATPTVAADPFPVERLPLLAFFDAATGELRATAPTAFPTRLSLYSSGAFWNIRQRPDSIEQVDPESHSVVNSYPLPVSQASGFAFSPEALWVTDKTEARVMRIDRATKVVSSYRIGEGADDTVEASDMVVGGGAVWISRPEVREVIRMDPRTGRVTKRIKDVAAFTLDFGEGALWYTDGGRLGRIDPASGATSPPITVAQDASLTNVTLAAGAVWVSSPADGLLYKVEPNGHVTPIEIEPGIGMPAGTADGVWVANDRTGTLTRVDVVTGERTTIKPGHAILSVAADQDNLMVTIGPTTQETIAGLGGSVLTLGVDGEPWRDPSPDPPANSTAEARQAAYLTCANLLAYPDEPAPSGWTLRPEVAVAMPEVSPDGRTYTFTIRHGFTFSPPSNAPVTAETFRSTLERAMSPTLREDLPGRGFLQDIVGAADFSAGKTEHIAGLAVVGDRLSIRLDAPAPDFLARLSLPYYCAVPDGTPIVREGLDPDPPVSSAGPYYLDRHSGGRMLILKQNPNYHGSRPRPFDAIVLLLQTGPAGAIAEANSGRIDGAMLPGWQQIASPGGALAREWGPGSSHAASGDQRWFGASRFGSGFIALNPTRGLFRSLDARRAVAAALDRRAIADVFFEAPSAALLPPSVPGGPDLDAVVPAPDLDLARRLLGRTATITAATWKGCDDCDRALVELTNELREIGVEMKVRHTDDLFAELNKADSSIDLAFWGSGSDLPDPVAVLGGVADLAWFGKANHAQIDRMAALSGQERIDAAAALARSLTDDQVLAIPTSYPVYPMFFSGRIGCQVIQPAIGAVDLLRLCRRPEDESMSPSP